MYFPYLRGKQYELIALDELAHLIADSGKIIPIIEPVRRNFSKFPSFVKQQMPFILVTNPIYGDFREDALTLQEELIEGVLAQYDNYYLGYVIDKDTNLLDVNNFLRLNEGRKICIIHYFNVHNYKGLHELLEKHSSDIKFNVFIESKTGKMYRDFFTSSPKVLIKDGFDNDKRNADYPDDEFFSDLNLTYKDEGCEGFGDFLMVGDYFSTSGGPAHAVAIHFSYMSHEGGDIWMKHYKSDRNDSPVDTPGKFLEALTKLHADIFEGEDGETKEAPSNSSKEFLDLYNRQHYPGLGYLKKISMKHHIEIMLGSLN